MAKRLDSLRVAIVHDWLVGGGAELVVVALHEMFPDAPIYTSYATAEWRQKLGGKVVTGPLQHWPFSVLRKFIPVLRIWWFGHLKFDGYDLVISSSGAEAKGIKVPKGVTHINYCHAPTHYYWKLYDQYMAQPGFGLFDSVARLGLRLLVGPLRKWDFKAASRPDVMVANSTYTQHAIHTYYKRSAAIIFPPVNVERFAGQPDTQRHGYVTAGRQTPYKRLDLAVAACTKLNVSLIVIGNGPEHKRLMSKAGPTVTFLANVSDSDMPKYFAGAEAFIFPGLDDFGIVAVEALAAGTPVVAYEAGGALDYIEPNKTGVFFVRQAVSSLHDTLGTIPLQKFDNEYIKQSAQRFSSKTFKDNFAKLIQESV